MPFFAPFFIRGSVRPGALRRAARALPFAVLATAALATEPKRPATPPPDGDNSYRYLGRLLDQKARELDWGEGTVGFAVVDPVHRMAVHEFNGDLALPACSIAKIYTAAAAAEILGPEFTFKTTIEARGTFEKKRLVGSLVIRGEGDPTISSAWTGSAEGLNEAFDRWIEILKKRKVKTIEGPIVVDASAFDDEAFAVGWPIEDGVAQLPEVSAVNFNDNCVDIVWQAGKKPGKIAAYAMLPKLPDFVFFSNNVRVRERGFGGRQYAREAGSNVISASGHAEVGLLAEERVTIFNPPMFFGRALKERLKEKGIKVTGEIEIGPPAEGGAAQGEILDTRTSPPLREILQRMLRDDRHLDAEVVVKTLARRATGKPGSFGAGAEAVMKFARERHLPSSGLALMDGSGLSAMDRVTARQAVGLLDYLREAPRSKWLMEGFAETGKPGVMERRMRPAVTAEAAAERPVPWAQAVAGGRRGAQAMAGWAKTKGGAPLNFAILVGGSKLTAEELQQRMDAVISIIAESAIR